MIKHILILAFLLPTVYGGVYAFKYYTRQVFYRGISQADQDVDTCLKNQGIDDKKTFPEYYKACNRLCKTLYNEPVNCISRISGGDVSCICDQ